MVARFRLDLEFIEKYQMEQPSWGPLGYFTYKEPTLDHYRVAALRSFGRRALESWREYTKLKENTAKA